MRGVRGHGSVRRTAAALVTTGVAAAVLAGCGGAGTGAELTPGPAPQSSSASPTPSPETTTSAAPTTTVPAPTTRAHRTTAPHAVTPAPAAGAQAAPAMIWPVTEAAAAKQLQVDVDGGSQPWLLDPQEVALSYTSSVYGWTSPETTPGGGGTVQVQDAQGGRATVHLVQPVRAGAGGIWVVRAAERT